MVLADQALALIVYAMGFGVRLSILAVLSSFVSAMSESGKLYTLVATTDAIAHLIASPLLQYLWSRALKIGGRWIVLPFMVLTVDTPSASVPPSLTPGRGFSWQRA